MIDGRPAWSRNGSKFERGLENGLRWSPRCQEVEVSSEPASTAAILFVLGNVLTLLKKEVIAHYMIEIWSTQSILQCCRVIWRPSMTSPRTVYVRNVRCSIQFHRVLWIFISPGCPLSNVVAMLWQLIHCSLSTLLPNKQNLPLVVCTSIVP
jgi:hypothetical protein